jgi:hypothetical protein
VIVWVWIPLRRDVLDTTLCDKVCQWLAAGWWFSSGTPVSSIYKTDRTPSEKVGQIKWQPFLHYSVGYLLCWCTSMYWILLYFRCYSRHVLYVLNLISTFLLLSLGWYLCWWTISPEGIILFSPFHSRLAVLILTIFITYLRGLSSQPQ